VVDYQFPASVLHWQSQENQEIIECCMVNRRLGRQGHHLHEIFVTVFWRSYYNVPLTISQFRLSL
jgi:hypothetical protein